MSAVSEGVLFGFGNPLLDISAQVPLDFLKKYSLEPNNAILAEERHFPMYEEMKNFDHQFIPGGATLNSIRYAQWLLGGSKSCVYMGSIGKDGHADLMKSLSQEAGVNAVFYCTDKAETGTCAVCITGRDRSLVANLAAANLFDKAAHLDLSENWALVEKARIFYNAGFFLTVSPPTIMAIAKHACEANKIYCTNLSAPFLCQFFKEPMMEAMPYVDYLFGNETEAVCFAEQRGWATRDVGEIACLASQLPKMNSQRDRYVVFTQGSEATLVAFRGQLLAQIKVDKLDQDKIVDTNSAGDAFVGGFLANLALGKCVEDCVRLAHAAARYCIQQSGSLITPSDRDSLLNQ